jgi:2-polyprenyl-3-methyl-5-hydroxy-6-metoxy-1,4-benzoquinol methylase
MAFHDPWPDLQRFYTERYVEDERLRMSPHGRLELIRTRQLPGRAPAAPPARVRDAGGGTGVHARWLAELGYEVELVMCRVGSRRLLRR